MVDEIRPLLWQHPQRQEHIASVNTQRLAGYCAKYSSRQGHRHSELQRSLISFLDVVQNQFSAPTAVLLPAEMFSRLSNAKLSNDEPQLCP